MSTGMGIITVTRHTDEATGAETFTAEYEGGPVIWISNVLIDDPHPPFERDGDVLTICQYRLRLREKMSEDGRYYIADRIDA